MPLIAYRKSCSYVQRPLEVLWNSLKTLFGESTAASSRLTYSLPFSPTLHDPFPSSPQRFDPHLIVADAVKGHE